MLQFFVAGSAGQRDPVKNFCRRFGHQTAVIEYQDKQRLYIDGGLLNWDLQTYPNNYTSKCSSRLPSVPPELRPR